MSWYVVTVPISSRAKVPGKVGPWRQAAGVGDTAVEISLVGWDGGGGGSREVMAMGSAVYSIWSIFY